MFNKKDKETASHSEPEKNTDIAANITGDAVCTTVVAREEIGQKLSRYIGFLYRQGSFKCI